MYFNLITISILSVLIIGAHIRISWTNESIRELVKNQSKLLKLISLLADRN